MKKKAFFPGIFAALFFALMISGNADVSAQHSYKGQDVQSQSHGAFTATDDKPFAQLMNDAMMAMESAMKAAPMTGNPDHDFAVMMIPHHQGAIDMAKAELLYGKDPILRRLAQEVIVTQEQEIQLMRERLKKF